MSTFALGVGFSVVLAAAQLSSAADREFDDARLIAMVGECVIAQRNEGNINVYSASNGVVEVSTLIEARIRYIPGGSEIRISLIPEESYPDAPWGKCVISNDGGLAALTFSLGGAHFEGKSYRPLVTDSMTESELRSYIERKDWVTTMVDIRTLFEKR